MAAGITVGLIADVSLAQMPATTRATDGADRILLNFPENVELKVVIDYVSRRLNVNILYDEQAVAQRVTIKAPAEVARGSLQGLLESALRMKGLALVDGDQAGWKRVVPAAGFASSARPTTGPSGAVAGTPAVVTQVFSLENADPQKLNQAVKPFLTQPGGNSVPIPDGRALIVTDFGSNVERIGELVRIFDRPRREAAVSYVAIANVEATALAAQVTQILTSKSKSPSAGAAPPPDAVDVIADARTNRLVLIGSQARIAEATSVIGALDVPLGLETKVYQFQTVAPERVDRLVKELIPPQEVKRLYQSAADKDANLLVVTSTAAIHAKVEQIKRDLDVPAGREQSPIRFYKLMNTTAADVLQTIAAVTGDGAVSRVSFDETSPTPTARPEVESGSVPPAPGSALQPVRPSAAPLGANGGGLGENTPVAQRPAGRESSGSEYAESRAMNADAIAGNASLPMPAGDPFLSMPQSVKTSDGSVTSDPNTNSIIVVGPPASQRVYEQLILALDKRRPQVLVECTIVALDTSDNFSFGVEVGVRSGLANTDFITFSSFGIGTPNANTGQVALTPGAGFNGAVINSDVASLVLRALATTGRARVLSAPRVLVNDNATGTLASVSEAPFTSINGITGNTSTTTFAGYASAGTTISLTPHISEGDHLQLDYSVALNSFANQQTATTGVPPPRQTDSVASKVTIPDGNTVVVGGLNRKNVSDTINKVPILGDIPLVRLLFRSRATTDSTTTLFVFLRPVILRDDTFADLKYYSERDVKAAGLAGDYPTSEPLTVQ